LVMPLGYYPCGTLPQENPLITRWQDWKKNTAPPVLLISPCIQVIIQAIVSKCQAQLLQTLIILFIVSVEGEWLENVQPAKVFTPVSCRICTLTNYLTCWPFDCLKFSQKILWDTRWMSGTFAIYNMPYYVYSIITYSKGRVKAYSCE
jgi:hypothetical protein